MRLIRSFWNVVIQCEMYLNAYEFHTSSSAVLPQCCDGKFPTLNFYVHSDTFYVMLRLESGSERTWYIIKPNDTFFLLCIINVEFWLG